MTAREDELRRRDGSSKQPYEERWPRYVHNAVMEAKFAHGRRIATNKGAGFARTAAENALRNGDEHAHALYAELAETLDDIAGLHEDVEEIEIEIAHHYGFEDIDVNERREME